MAEVDSFAEQQRASEGRRAGGEWSPEANVDWIDALVLWKGSVSSMQRDAALCNVT